MSTIPTLQAHESSAPPRLVRFIPRFVGHECQVRRLTMLASIHTWIANPGRSEALRKVKAQARSHFGEFVKGAEIDDLSFMKRVEDRRQNPPSFAHEVWSIRPRFDPPQHRYFGVFVTNDWFLVCTKRPRNWFDGGDHRWHAEIDKTLRVWGALFPAGAPHSGNQLRDYVSSNARHCDDRW